MILNKPDLIENKPLKYEELSIGDPLPEEITIRIKSCGVCHTDLHEVEGELNPPKLPIIPGHEIIGVVDNLGENVTQFKKGDRIGIPWLNSSCSNCKYCTRGQENLCESAKFTGFHVNGGYAEYTNIHNEYVHKIPNSFDDVHAAPLLCAGIIGYRSIKLSEIKPGEKLGLFGFGASAHIVIQIAKFWDCEIYVFTRSKKHQSHAAKLGATWVGTSKEKPPDKVDSAILFAPIGHLVIDSLKNLDKGGILAINAIYLTDIPSIKWDLLYHERKIISVANATRKDAIEFLDLAGKIPIVTNTVEYDLKQANLALYEMKYSKINGAAVLKIGK